MTSTAADCDSADSDTIDTDPADIAIDSVGDAATDRRHKLDTAISALSGMATYGLAIITGPILAWKLSGDGRGSLGAVVVPTQIIAWVLMFGLPQATAFYAKVHPRRLLFNSAWRFTLLTGVPLIAVIWFLVPAFLTKHPPVTVTWFRAYLFAGLLVLPFTTLIDHLRGTADNIRFNVYRAMPFVLNTAFIVVLAAIDQLTLVSALGATFAANLGSYVLALVGERALPTTEFSGEVFRRQLSYGRRVWVGTLSNMIVGRFDQFLMVVLVEPVELGAYIVAATAAGVSAPLAQGVAFALFPYLRDEGGDAGWERTNQAMRWTALASIAVAVVVGALAPFVLPLLGDDFTASVTPLWFLLPGQVFWNLANVLSAKLEADDRPGAASIALAVAAVITIVTIPIVVPTFGIQGAAVVTSTSQLAFFLYAWFAARR